MNPDAETLNGHYGSDDLAERIREALGAGPVTRDDLANLDEFHTPGREATREMAALGDLQSGMRVLDLGCGLGGPARTFAAEYGCTVDGVEIVPGFCRAATMLNGMTGLAGAVTVHEADMRRLPFADGLFDRAMALHVLLNVPDKTALADEVRRVLAPEGKLCLYEVCSGDGGPVDYPVPWAAGPDLDHLAPEEDLKAALAESGFELETWEDVTARVLAWFDGLAAQFEGRKPRRSAGPTLGLVMGPDAARKSMNLRRNLQEDRIRIVTGRASV